MLKAPTDEIQCFHPMHILTCTHCVYVYIHTYMYILVQIVNICNLLINKFTYADFITNMKCPQCACSMNNNSAYSYSHTYTHIIQKYTKVNLIASGRAKGNWRLSAEQNVDFSAFTPTMKRRSCSLLSGGTGEECIQEGI